MRYAMMGKLFLNFKLKLLATRAKCQVFVLAVFTRLFVMTVLDTSTNRSSPLHIITYVDGHVDLMTRHLRALSSPGARHQVVTGVCTLSITASERTRLKSIVKNLEGIKHTALPWTEEMWS